MKVEQVVPWVNSWRHLADTTGKGRIFVSSSTTVWEEINMYLLLSVHFVATAGCMGANYTCNLNRSKLIQERPIAKGLDDTETFPTCSFVFLGLCCIANDPIWYVYALEMKQKCSFVHWTSTQYHNTSSDSESWNEVSVNLTSMIPNTDINISKHFSSSNHSIPNL